MTAYVIVEGLLHVDKDLRIEFRGSSHTTRVFAGNTDISHMLTGINIDVRPGGQVEIKLYVAARGITGELLGKKDDTQASSD